MRKQVSVFLESWWNRQDLAMQPTIYLIDADPKVLEAVVRVIKPIGANVETCCRADDFLGKFRDTGPACVVLEARLPDMSGLELQRLLNRRGCQIPIVFLAGDANIPLVVEAMKAGAAHFFEKPFQPHKLFDEIVRLLRKDSEGWPHCERKQGIEEALALLKRGERAVLERIAAGKTNKEIAQELALGLRTVEKRRAKAMKDLRVDSKAELMHMLHVTVPIRKPRKCLRCEMFAELSQQDRIVTV